MTLDPELRALFDAVLPLVQRLHRSGDLAPLAAALDATGQVKLMALAADEPQALSAEQAVAHFHAKLGRDAAVGAIFFHARSAAGSVAVARSEREANALAAALERPRAAAVLLVLPYRGEGDAIEYAAPVRMASPADLFPGPEIH